MDVLRTTIGDVPLEEYHWTDSTHGPHAWRILHSGAIITHDDEQRFLGAETRLPYGIVLWPASIALAHEIVSRPAETWRGKTVLELGAGTGLPGVIAASLGARVRQTDLQDVALAVAKMNAQRNNVAIDHAVADWTAWTDETRYDVILGADILYGTTMHEHLRKIFAANLAPGGRILLADPLRKQSFALFEEMEAEGWRVTFDKWTVEGPNRAEIGPSARPIGVFELRRAD